MSRVDKILVGSPTYKTVVGNVTRVHKVVVGTPLTSVTIGPYADIDNIVGVNTAGKADGYIFIYDSASGNFVVRNNPVLDVDGGVYPSDSAHTNILIRRSGTAGEPTGLQQGEIAYSFLADPATDGFGNGGDRLYIATGADSAGVSTRIDVIGGKYFTDLLNHQHGILTSSSALITDSNGSLNRILADSATFTIGRFTDIYTQNVNLTASTIKSDSASLQDNSGGLYFSWSNTDSAIRGYYGGQEAFRTSGDSNSLAGLLVRNHFTVEGKTFLDSTTVDGPLTVTGNLVVQGTTTNISTTELLIEDKQIVIADNVPFNTPTLANGAGIAIGDSAYPIATLRYLNDGVDSAVWSFNPGIQAKSIDVTNLEFAVIDCGTYA